MEDSEKDIVQKFIKGECPANELNRIREMAPEVFEKHVQTLTLEEDRATNVSVSIDKMYKRIEKELDCDRRSFKIYPYLRAAAAVLFLLGSLSWYYFKYGQEVEYAYATTKEADQIKVSLEDGTTVWLNSYSLLKYPKHFGADKREVFLDGEAYFEVKKESARPFLVHFDKLEVRVLGTTFSVKSFSNESDKYVTLLTGIVNVKHGKRELKMRPGEETHINQAGEAKKYKANLSVSMAWREEVFQFQQAPLTEVIVAFKRWYGADIEIPDKKLHRRKVTIRINPREKLYVALNALTAAVDLKYKKEGNGFIISK
ncbi:MAG: hypothetical protein CRN43_18005 [Candidatus Nephrothrix sp. EaCA]|nr:MAG: hypothetical protein CRN43_18005 [Candidatus Nephrothrix sp. EaCA]